MSQIQQFGGVDRARALRRKRFVRQSAAAGMTLIELILACAILLILTSAAMPIMRYTIVHKREQELRYDLPRDTRRDRSL